MVLPLNIICYDLSGATIAPYAAVSCLHLG